MFVVIGSPPQWREKIYNLETNLTFVCKACQPVWRGTRECATRQVPGPLVSRQALQRIRLQMPQDHRPQRPRPEPRRQGERQPHHWHHREPPGRPRRLDWPRGGELQDGREGRRQDPLQREGQQRQPRGRQPGCPWRLPQPGLPIFFPQWPQSFTAPAVWGRPPVPRPRPRVSVPTLGSAVPAPPPARPQQLPRPWAPWPRLRPRPLS